jgi:hypothetical protein
MTMDSVAAVVYGGLLVTSNEILVIYFRDYDERGQ